VVKSLNPRIRAVDVMPDVLGAAQIGPGAVGTSELADGAVTSGKVASGQIGAAHIAADAVTATQIASGQVGASELADDAVKIGHMNEYHTGVVVPDTATAYDHPLGVAPSVVVITMKGAGTVWYTATTASNVSLQADASGRSCDFMVVA